MLIIRELRDFIVFCSAHLQLYRKKEEQIIKGIQNLVRIRLSTYSLYVGIFLTAFINFSIILHICTLSTKIM